MFTEYSRICVINPIKVIKEEARDIKDAFIKNAFDSRLEELKDMKFKIRENNNYELITFKHKVALQAMNMIEDKDITLYSEVLLYAQLSFVQQSCEEDIIGFLNNSMEQDLLTLMETVIEPIFMEIMTDEKAKNAFDEIVDILSDYLYNKREGERSFGGYASECLG